MKRGGILLSIGGGLFFVLFVLISIFAVLFMGGWEEYGLEEGQEDATEILFNNIPLLIPVYEAMAIISNLAIIVTIIGAIVWYRQRKREKNLKQNP